MELSPSVLQALQVSGSSTLSDDAFRKLATSAVEVALEKDGAGSRLQGESQLDQAAAKEAFAALTTLFLEVARTDTNNDSISAVLEECGLPSDRIKIITALYTDHRAKLRANLGRVSSTLPYIVDVDWRLDYYLKNNHLEKVNKPVYLIDLKTQESDKVETENVQFACTQEQLQDLVTKLRDATKSMEKFSQ